MSEFALTHKTVFASTQGAKSTAFCSSKDGESPKDYKLSPPRSKEEFACFYCHKVEHVITNCLALKRKTAAPAKTLQQINPCLNNPESKSEDGFEAFMLYLLFRYTKSMFRLI